MDLLDVPPGMLRAVRRRLRRGRAARWPRARARALRADYALSITGVAGPDGGTPEKPVGLVYLGCAGPDGTRVRRGSFPGDRDSVRTFARHLARSTCCAAALPRVSGEAERQGRAPAALRRLRPAPGRRARRDRAGSASGSPAHEDLRIVADAAPHARVPRRASTPRACPTSSASSTAIAGRAPSAASRSRCSCRRTASDGSSRWSSTTRPGELRRAAGGGVGRARGRGPLRAREAALAAPRHGGQIPPSRSPFFPAKREHRRIWCRPDGLV